MKIKDSFISHESDGESMLIPTGDAKFSGIVKGNSTLGAIIGYLMEETTEEEVVGKMMSRFDAPREIIVRDVEKVITELRGIGALDE